MLESLASMPSLFGDYMAGVERYGAPQMSPDSRGRWLRLTEPRTADRRDTAGAAAASRSYMSHRSGTLGGLRRPAYTFRWRHRPAAAPNSPVATSSRAVGSGAGSAVGSCATPRGVPLAHVMKRLSYRGTGAPFAPGQAESYCARTGALPAVCLESFARRPDRVMKGNRRLQCVRHQSWH
jgi:hypothetical protein